MTAVVETAGIAVRGLGKGYRSSVALRDCTFDLPAGRVAALVGANGAGKTTLLTVLSGLLRPDAGEFTLRPGERVAFVAQEKPVYKHLTPRVVLQLAARLNLVWDQARAQAWLERFDIPLDRRCGQLSGGQRTQVALAVAIGSRPTLLLLDEPLADLDPLARTEVMRDLLSEVADSGATVVMSTHIVTELSGVVDHLLLLAHGTLLADGDLDELLAAHVMVVGPRAQESPVRGEVLWDKHLDGQSLFLVRTPTTPVVSAPWVVRPVSLEDYVLALLSATRKGDVA
ncbi:ATP-binding cassette domain-containing protein [Umezawaea tangerina]|uniref:ABC-2 type transport system ATP-binding protein n=1 Tax=Umezawaea tangerina TaxID=84725 RepID=A0A2T0TDT3_9PSEU|nr:ABC transporter ATP-binding protein [Umezawaea tangerina]PRY43817.1 ABC-2 type transport system ATP-binding protein [Umezawaea tangerina]